jgi:hypothetical protein
METNWLDAFNSQHVTVVTQAGPDERTDTGTLLRIGEGWLQLVKDNGEMVLIPSTAIRLVKLLDMVHRAVAVENRPELGYPRISREEGTPVRSNAPDDQAVI